MLCPNCEGAGHLVIEEQIQICETCGGLGSACDSCGRPSHEDTCIKCQLFTYDLSDLDFLVPAVALTTEEIEATAESTIDMMFFDSLIEGLPREQSSLDGRMTIYIHYN